MHDSETEDIFDRRVDMIIDAHCHIWSFEGVPYYGEKSLFTYMREQKIDKISMICMNESENERMRGLVRKYPEQLFGVSYVDVSNMDTSLKELRNDVKNGLVHAVKIYPYFEHFFVDSRELYPFYETVRELDIPVIPHLGWVNMDVDRSCGNKGAYRYTGFPAQYGTVLEDFPGLKIVFTHLGGNYYYEFLTMAERFPSVMMETAWLPDYCTRQFPPLDMHAWLRHAIAILGAGRVMYGGEGVFPSDIEMLGFSAKETAMILGENAKAYFRLD